MKTWPYAFVCAVLLPALGCRTDQNLVLLENENRRIEDVTYELKGELEDCQQKLAAVQRENDSLRKKQEGKGADAEAASSQPVNVQEPPGSALDGNASPAPPFTPATPPSSAPPPPSEKSPPVHPTAQRNSVTGPLAARNVSSNSRPVEKIVLERMHTGGYHTVGQAADEGIAVLIEPRDADGRFVEAVAPVVVVVMDGEATGKAAHFARWDFSLAEVSAAFRKTAHGHGIYLELPWPVGPPAHAQLQVFVRYITSDGRKLETHLPIQVRLPGQMVRASERPSPGPAASVPATPPASPPASPPAGPALGPTAGQWKPAATGPAMSTPAASAPSETAPIWQSAPPHDDDAPPLLLQSPQSAPTAPRSAATAPEREPELMAERPVWSPNR